MKKALAFIGMALASFTQVNAQKMIAYDMQISNTPYEEITDGNALTIEDMEKDFTGIVYDGSGAANYSSFTAAGFPIGFDFSYNGQTMNQFLIASDGYIILGKDEVSASVPMNSFFVFNNQDDKNVLGMTSISGAYGLPQTQISYKTIGTAPERVLVVQYKNLGIIDRTFSGTLADTVQVQLRLYEATGNLSISLNGFEPSAEANMDLVSVKMGIKGDIGDKLMLSDFTSGQTTTNDQMIAWRHETFPADGTVYTFIAPEPCNTPTTQPTDFKFSAATTSLSGTFTPAEDADHCLVLATTDTELTEMPADKTEYTVGSALGNAIVVAATDGNQFNSGDILTGSTTYNLFAMSYNSRCLDGPLYNTNSPVTATIRTLAGPPAAINIVNADRDVIEFNVEAADNSPVLIAMSDSVVTMKSGMTRNEGAFGTPSGIMNVGDAWETEGGKVVFVGVPDGNIRLEGLEPGHQYFIKAWSTDGNGNYSSEAIERCVYAASDLPWTTNFENTMLMDHPLGWTSNGGSWMINRDRNVEGTIDTADPENGTVAWVETPDMYMGALGGRMFVSLSMTGSSKWTEKDSLAVQISSDGVNYKDIAVFDINNKEDIGSSMRPFTYTFEECAGEKVRIRFYARSTQATTLAIGKLSIIEKPACDYPVNLKFDSAEGTSATVSWESQGDEDAWEVNYRLYGTEDWGEAHIARERSYTLTDLDSYATYEVRVRAMCSETSHSDWTETLLLKSALRIPFEINFRNEVIKPVGWRPCKGKLEDPIVLEDNNDFYYSNYYGEPSLEFSHYGDNCSSWYVSPQLDLGTAKEYEMSLNMITSYYSSSVEPATDDEIRFMIAADGEQFTSNDCLRLIKHDEYAKEGTEFTFTAPVKGFNGKVRLALLVTNTAGTPLGFEVVKIGLKEMVPDNINGINGADGSKAIEGIYTIDGRKMNGLRKGINIIRFSDGETKKVVIK